MIWCLTVAVLLVVIGVLGVLPSSDLELGAIRAYTDGFYVVSILLLGRAFLYYKCVQWAQKTHRLVRTLSLFGVALMASVLLGLFMLRTVAVYTEFEQSVPKQSYTVQAQVHIDEISDSIYDPLLSSDYRQKATITDIKLVDNHHKYASSAKAVVNPFGVQADTPKIELPQSMTVLLSASANSKQELSRLGDLVPSSRVSMTLVLSPAKPSSEAQGFDGYRWLRTRHIHANAKILSIDSPTVIYPPANISVYLQTLRQNLREHFYQNWHTLSNDSRQAKAVSLSLLTGDRALISRDIKQLYQFAGISHLLAISGSHVVFLALILAWLTTFVLDKTKPSTYQYITKQTISSWVMVISALLYALFTGFDVPAVRTVYMLLAFVLVRQLALPVSNLTVLVVVALLMVWLDPFVVWQAGFYLSFVAVLLLVRYEGQNVSTHDIPWRQKLLELVKLQTWLFMAMLPISIWIFGKVSLWGLLVNLFAVGLFGMVVVPINLLAGVIFVLMPWLADVLWSLGSGILWLLHAWLGVLASLGNDVWLYNSMGAMGLVLGVLALLPFVLPVLKKRLSALPVLVLMGLLFIKTADFSINVLPSSDGQVSQILLRQAGADPDSVSAEANWLVLSDLGSRLTADRLASELIDNLKKHRVRHLTGVVVQTPSAKLAEVAQQISEHIPIYHRWQAGQVASVASCTAGKTWQGEGLSVQALTGWTQIKDEHVWGCALVFESIYAPNIQGVIDDVDDGRSFVAGDKDTAHRVLVAAIDQSKAWELYALMCHATDPVDVWLTHSGSPLSKPILELFEPKVVLFSDPDSKQNRQKIHQMLTATSF